MDDYSQETLRKIERNADSVIELGICNRGSVLSRDIGRYFTSRDGDDYSTLGNCIKNNTHLKTLYFELEGIRLSITDSGFFEGIRQNSSIEELKISGYSTTITNHNPIGFVGCELLETFQENSRHLTSIHIWACDVRDVDERIVINTTLSRCTNLKRIRINHTNMADEQLMQMVESVKGHQSLEDLRLDHNRIGNVGCGALATLLQDSSCNLVTLHLNYNHINNEGVIAIANSLASNNKLKELVIGGNHMHNQHIVEDAFFGVLCNTTSINATYSSNHTLTKLPLPNFHMGNQLLSLLKLNMGTNKKYVAIKKILRYHPNIEMEQLFEWGSKDEQNLLSLPYVVSWFNRADEAVEHVIESGYNSDLDYYYNVRDDYDYQVEEEKLTAIYEFALAMPLLFIPKFEEED